MDSGKKKNGAGIFSFIFSVISHIAYDLTRIKEFFFGAPFEFGSFQISSPWLARLLFAPLRFMFSPTFEGLENIPKDMKDRPILFVSNHQISGLDMPLFFTKVFEHTGRPLRALGDHFHFRVPFHSRFFKFCGAVDGSPENCLRLLREKLMVLVYPGGGREILKMKTDKPYELMWKNRIGFARYAIQEDAIIIPVSAIGLDDSLWILFDLPVSFFLKLIGDNRELTWPVFTPTIPERIYFKTQEPIDTRKFRPKSESKSELDECATKLRDLTKDKVERGIQDLLVKRKSDPDRYLPHRIVRQLTRSKSD